MNEIKATLKSIVKRDSLHIVELVFDGEKLYLLALELPQNLYIGQSVTVAIKPTQIALAKDFDLKTSFDNQLKGSVATLEIGELLVSVKVAVGGTILESVITYKSYLRMNFQVGDSIILLLPSSELAIL
ncbi:Molybdate-binding domain of ModE [hydrothermal vent metagenome]|uniref:Molybdate-binding domain of ModE n=1 Tax=hydrothermal vent metagenome TaxID=652676 RepID=A0A1W1C502_9ZZZZ